MRVRYFDRAAWGADVSFPRRGVFVAPEDREGLVLHHSVGGKLLAFSVEAALAYVRWLQTGVAARLGADIPYSFVPSLVRLNGTFEVILCEGRGWFRSGAHTVDTIDDDDPVEDENKTLLATGWQGDWRKYAEILSPYGDPETIVDDAVSSVGRFLGEQAQTEIPDHNIVHVFGHRQFKQTSCPSDVLFARRDLLIESFKEADIVGFGFENEEVRDWLQGLYDESHDPADPDRGLPSHPKADDGQAFSPKSWREFGEANRWLFDGFGVDLRDDQAVHQLGQDIAAAISELQAHLTSHPDGGSGSPTEPFTATITPTD